MFTQNSRGSVLMNLALQKKNKAFMEYPAVNKEEIRKLSSTVNRFERCTKRVKVLEEHITDDEDSQDAYECHYDIEDDTFIHKNEDIAKAVEILTPTKRKNMQRSTQSTRANFTEELSDLNNFVGEILSSCEVPLPSSNPATPTKTVNLSEAALTPTIAIPLETDFVVESDFHKRNDKERKQKKRIVEKPSMVSKHPLLPTCSCKKDCIGNIPGDRRHKIHQQFWNMKFGEQGVWLLHNVRQAEVARRRSRKGGVREFSYEYSFKNEEGETFKVCQQFFRNTLGLKSNKKLFYFFKNVTPGDMKSPEDRRGKTAAVNKISEITKNLIDNHILAHNPAISHYRREHAPNRLYITSEMNATLMHADFLKSYPNNKICYDIYRQQLKKMNIGFGKLGEEECETCLEYDEHKKRNLYTIADSNIINSVISAIVNDTECLADGCLICKNQETHLMKKSLSRFEYKSDCFLYNSSKGESVVAVDMQKVVMLPRMPGVKKAIFTRRLVAFHMTFAPLGGHGHGGRPTGIIWNESVSGRNDEDVTSTYVKYIEFKRDHNRFTFWADNCSAQNKNWTLFTTFVQLVNDEKTNCEEITMKYFEPGHTWMAADSFHRSVEQEMKRRKTVYDFTDFEDTIRCAKGIPLLMQPEDFKEFPSKQSRGAYTKYPLLDKIVVVKFTKGSSKMYWKEYIHLVEF